MNKFFSSLFIAFIFLLSTHAFAQTDRIVLKDISWDKVSPANFTELFIPSNNFLLAGFMYKPNGAKKHPTLLLLHGYPGNERNLDIAQIVRTHGWNVIYFDYRGTWGSQGKFSFKNCVEDVVNVVAFCKKYQDSLQIDTSNIVLFGHSMGGWVCLKALQQLPTVKKGFALSTWDIYADFKNVKSEQQIISKLKEEPYYFVLNTPKMEIFKPVLKDPGYFNLQSNKKFLANKQITMLDEHHLNKEIAEAFKKENKAYFEYAVWQTDHSFTNKRVSLMNKVLAFLDK